MPSYAVIGGSRGIGLEYVRQLASRPDSMVFAVVRNPEGSTHLKALAATLTNIHIIPGDVVDYSSLESAAKQVSEITGGKLDCLIHNAANTSLSANKGYDDYANMEELDAAFISAYKVNSLGPIHAITAFLPLLRASAANPGLKKVVVIGSGAGDMATTRALRLPHMVAYAMTKAAAHMAVTKFAVKLQAEREGAGVVVVVTLCPGMVDCSATAGANSTAVVESLQEFAASVKRETGLEVAPQTPEESVGEQLKVIDGLQASHNGLFLQHMGGEYRPQS